MPKIDYLPPQELKPWAGNARRHSRKQIKQLIESIRRFGFTSPVVIDDEGHILAGHGRVQAACALGLADVPCHRLDHLSETEKRAYVIADNKLALNASWDRKLLSQELSHFRMQEIDFDVGVIGFSTAEMDEFFGTTFANKGPDPADDDNRERAATEARSENSPARAALTATSGNWDRTGSFAARSFMALPSKDGRPAAWTR